MNIIIVIVIQDFIKKIKPVKNVILNAKNVKLVVKIVYRVLVLIEMVKIIVNVNKDFKKIIKAKFVVFF